MALLEKAQFLKPGAELKARKLYKTASFLQAIAELQKQQEKSLAGKKLHMETLNQFVGAKSPHA